VGGVVGDLLFGLKGKIDQVIMGGGSLERKKQNILEFLDNFNNAINQTPALRNEFEARKGHSIDLNNSFIEQVTITNLHDGLEKKANKVKDEAPPAKSMQSVAPGSRPFPSDGEKTVVVPVRNDFNDLITLMIQAIKT
jgi:hypothetical protein